MVSRTGLLSLPRTSTEKSIGVLAAQLEDVADLGMPRAETNGPGAVRRGVAVAHLGCLMVPSATKSRPATSPTTCLPSLVGAGDPRPVHHPRSTR